MKNLLLIALLSILTFTFSACGGDDATPTPTDYRDAIVGQYNASDEAILDFSEVSGEEDDLRSSTSTYTAFAISKTANSSTGVTITVNFTGAPNPYNYTANVAQVGTNYVFSIPSQTFPNYTISNVPGQLTFEGVILPNSQSQGEYNTTTKALRLDLLGVYTFLDNGTSYSVPYINRVTGTKK